MTYLYIHLSSYRNCHKIGKRQLKDLALKNNIIYVTEKSDNEEYTEQAEYMALNKNLTEPLLAWNFITVEKNRTMPCSILDK
jgi:hypothetical protein